MMTKINKFLKEVYINIAKLDEEKALILATIHEEISNETHSGDGRWAEEKVNNDVRYVRINEQLKAHNAMVELFLKVLEE